eukprot:COSAG02_NODE_7942_length_2776_cov_18.262234_3_plen_52_part_00
MPWTLPYRGKVSERNQFRVVRERGSVVSDGVRIGCIDLALADAAVLHDCLC